MDFTLQRSLIMYGILCALVGLWCILGHLYTPAVYLGAIGAIMGLMGGIVAWDTKRRAAKVVDPAIKALDKPKE